ncbi:MAG: molybdopterin-dependent oxidoreductase, partial [Hyphomonas sp.]|nr:molybdopterin-dependent oxidoreductase [Hyphomonas sp.]
MSHTLDRLTFFRRKTEIFSAGHGVLNDEDRTWEEAYRNRWRHDKIVRSTHGVNCTGSCSWKIYVKGGIVTWETQQTDYPRTRDDLPNHEPRGCSRGASYSWYLYSANRVKYPLIRARLLKAWRAARKTMAPVAAWKSIQEDPDKRADYVTRRGLGGFVRAGWEEVNEIIAAANAHTIRKWGPDRVFGFSPIPAMSMVSYAAGARYLQLIGGVTGSFYDWYCDLPPASPQTWGEQTDVAESADWYNSGFLILWGSNVPQTRTPDAHFYTEARYKGVKSVVICPDYSEASKFSDLWLAAKQGTDAALGMAFGHVILTEYHRDRQVPYFRDYVRQYTDLPLLVRLVPQEDGYVPQQLLRAADFDGALGESNNPDWKTVALDEKSGKIVVPNGSIGFRWGEDGKWNLEERDASGAETELRLGLKGVEDEIAKVRFPYFANTASNGFASTDHPSVLTRNIPVKKVRLADGSDALVACVYDLLMANYGVDQGYGGEHLAAGYDDMEPYTPAWAEAITSVSRENIIATARGFATNAEKTNGKSMV